MICTLKWVNGTVCEFHLQWSCLKQRICLQSQEAFLVSAKGLNSRAGGWGRGCEGRVSKLAHRVGYFHRGLPGNLRFPSSLEWSRQGPPARRHRSHQNTRHETQESKWSLPCLFLAIALHTFIVNFLYMSSSAIQTHARRPSLTSKHSFFFKKTPPPIFMIRTFVTVFLTVWVLEADQHVHTCKTWVFPRPHNVFQNSPLAEGDFPSLGFVDLPRCWKEKHPQELRGRGTVRECQHWGDKNRLVRLRNSPRFSCLWRVNFRSGPKDSSLWEFKTNHGL